jgi:hypothetical protein
MAGADFFGQDKPFAGFVRSGNAGRQIRFPRRPPESLKIFGLHRR